MFMLQVKALIDLALLAAILLGPQAALAFQAEGDGEGPDILPLALVTMGAIFAAAASGLVLYLFRLRIGFWLHRPPPANPDEHEEHH